MQVDKSLTRNHEGSGIGLSLVKSFVEMHNGQIWLESEWGKGSKFSFRLPCRIFDSAETEELSNRGGRIECNDFIERINIEFSDIYME
jgi:signal transduction histidine kinase